MIPLTKNIKLYAKLLLSVGQQGRGVSQRQPLQPVDCGELIKRLMDEENEDKANKMHEIVWFRTFGFK